MIIIFTARVRSKARGECFPKYLGKQFNKHYDLIILACLLVLFAVPRLIIYFYAGCMKSAREPWLALIGYFISFVPPALVFPIFVLPSTMYKSIWKDKMENYSRKIRKCLF